MLLVDTNIWLVAADRRSVRHDEITALLSAQDGLASPSPVIAETAWLILARLGTEAHQRFLRLVTETASRRGRGRRVRSVAFTASYRIASSNSVNPDRTGT